MPLKTSSFLSLAYISLLVFGSCQDQSKAEHQNTALVHKNKAPKETLFHLLSPDSTKVTFRNTLTEDRYSNILMYQYFYNGGGVAVGDINNDGLEDLYFSGNMTPNHLYLNNGNMKFQDITDQAGVSGKARAWKTGVSMADVNGDNLLDIYLCYSGNMSPDARKNELFINQGPDSTGVISFMEQAEQYGLADPSFSTNAYFFDYDKDNDLDMFLLNHNPALFRNLDNFSIQQLQSKPAPEFRIKLYQNNNGKFTDVSDKAGFYNSAFTYGLGAGVADFNQDGWPDIYVSNDYSAPDYLYLNNGDGTFTDNLKESQGHTPLYSMGNDVSDFNNDGLPDVYALDMLPEDNSRQKLLFAPDNYEHFNLFLRVGFHYQYMRNMLQVNNGDGTFSEAGQLAGVSNTDWSWAPLFADYDNDGWKDLFVSNGFLRDFTNLDFIKYRSSFFQNLNGNLSEDKLLGLISKIPSSNVNNYIFKNNGNLTFSNKGPDWGMDIPSSSNGAIYADLDNDGDLDLVTNNINQKTFIYRNDANKKLNRHYLQLRLKGNGLNTAGIGAKVTLYANGKLQYQEQMPARGYQSSVSPVLHFGLGKISKIDSIKIVWLGGEQQVLRNIDADQVLTFSIEEADSYYKKPAPVIPLFKTTASPLKFVHQQNKFNDFKRQPLLVNPLSFSGPCLVKADVNGDGLEDVFAGGGKGQAGVLYLQQRNGKFAAQKTEVFDADQASSDTDALFFDANKDGKPDLYVASGGYDDFQPKDPLLQDRLYLNDGKGRFVKASESLPVMLSSSACVRTTDMNGDGYQDLFIGSRVIPGRYPETPQSYLLINNGKGAFTDMTAKLAPQLEQIGMVTDAAWHDLNGDAIQELVVVGEWMPITVFKNENGQLKEDTKTYFTKTYSGWWNKLLIGDFNQDQKPDLVVANHGLNTQCKASDEDPAEMVYKDFDENGSVDPMLTFYIQGKSYPYVTRDELLDQISMMRTRFTTYESYANATLQEIFTTDELKGAGHLSANYLKTAYFESNSNGEFQLKELPIEAQLSPAFALTALDYNKDGNQDLLLCGNINEARLRFGKADANYGILLKGNGKGEFSYVPQSQSGFQLKGDVRSILSLSNTNTILFGMNQQEVKAYNFK